MYKILILFRTQNFLRISKTIGNCHQIHSPFAINVNKRKQVTFTLLNTFINLLIPCFLHMQEH